MQTVVTLEDRPIKIEVSPAACSVLAGRQYPLIVDMELYFSCLLRKKLHFLERLNDTLDADIISVTDKLQIRFTTVMSDSCSMDPEQPPRLVAFPIAQIKPFVPRWLSVDYRKGAWRGEFGFTESNV